MLTTNGIARGAKPFAGARGVLATPSSPSRRRRHMGELESPALLGDQGKQYEQL